MEKAKAAVSSFLSKDGKHQTSVDQDVNPAVTEEHVNPHQHENVTTAIDREVHKDHHYTTVQPVTHKETLPEQHHHNLIPVEHKSVDHGGQEELKSTLDRDAAQYQNTSTTHDTTHTQSAVPVMTGERVHHHVHEHVQPVIQKEVVEPHVVHTTIPVHETHTAAPVHHGTKVAPTKTMDEFMSGGGKLEGHTKKELFDYEGCPETEQSASHSHSHSGTGAATAAAAGAAGAGGIAAAKHHHDSSTREHGSHDNSALGGAGTTGTANDSSFGTTGTSTARDTTGTSNTLGGSTDTSRDTHGTATILGTSTSGTGRTTDTTTDTNTGLASDTTTSKPSTADKLKGALSGQSAPTEKHDKHEQYTDSSKNDGSFFGKDKTSSGTTSTGAAGTSTTDGTNLSGSKDSEFAKGDHYKHGVTGNDTYATDRVNDEGAFGGPGSVPRSDVNTTTGNSTTDASEPWRAGETHKDIAGDVHKAGQDHRASLMDKINPFKDADGDGKKGFMK